jgi:DNA-binding NarL/FixJ family response regulator
VTRILLVENDSLLLSALHSAFEQHGVTVVAACSGSEQAMTAAATETFDAVVTDLDLGEGPNGMVIALTLRRRQPGLGVVVLTSYSEPRLVGSKLSQLPPGSEYVLKHEVSDMPELCRRVERAIQRATVPAPGGLPEAATTLTNNQLDTMRLVAQGMTNAEIARTRNVTESAVERTLNRLANQLGVTADRSLNTRVQITRAYYALAGADGHDPLAP